MLVCACIRSQRCCRFALAERKAETQPYNTHDISMSDSERDRIYAILSSYGISDDNIALLPDSELQNTAMRSAQTSSTTR